MNKVCAVVVTYNRVDLLKECIKSIKSQTYPCDILVINNNSTDGTADFLKSTKIKHLDLEMNTGGAGGFNKGIRFAVEEGHESLWIMDDDCIPKNNALEQLVNASEILKNDYGFLASRVLWIDGKDHKMNKINKIEKTSDNFYKIKQATFVSLLVKTEIVRKYGLPIKEFFIWGDDIEFTRRISVRNNIPSYYVENSEVIHKTKNNIGSKIAFDDISNIERYKYAYRNEFYLYRQEGAFGVVYYLLKCFYNAARIIIFADNKETRLKQIIIGFKEGLNFNPCVEFV